MKLIKIQSTISTKKRVPQSYCQWRRSFSSCLMAIVIALGVLCTLPFSVKAAAPGVAYRSQSEIIDFVKKTGAKIGDAFSYESQPSARVPFSPGQLSDSSLQSALGMLNQIRYIAGLNGDITLDRSVGGYNDMAQAAALNLAATGSFTHTPAQAPGMPNELYTLGYNGAKSSNLYWSTPVKTLNFAMLQGYMADNDIGNISVVGHRRWVLNPSMAKTGFGQVGVYSVMYAHDKSRSAATEKNVVWPAQNTPYDYFCADYPWTLSVGKSVQASSVVVSLTRSSNGQKWQFSSSSKDGDFYVNNGGYGLSGCVIFRPASGVIVAPGESYTVSVTGIPEPVSYTVNFFDLAAGNTAAATTKPATTKATTTKPATTKADTTTVQKTVSVKSVSLSKTKATLGVGQTLRLKASVSPQNASDKKVTYKSSKPGVASVNKNTGLVSAKKRGNAVISVKTTNGKTKKCKIKVLSAPKKIKLPATVSLGVGENYTPAAEYTPNNAHKERSYKSNKPAVAIVNKTTGKITAKAVGTAKITVKAYNGKQSTISVTVKKEPGSIKINKKSIRLKKGTSIKLKSSVPSGTESNSRLWSSSKKSVATVSKKTGKVKAVGKGSCKIKVKSYNGRTKTCKITVY